MRHESQRQRLSMLGHVVYFARALHSAGIPVNSANLLDLCQCFDYIDIAQRADFYAAACATLISDQNDLAEFDRIFSQYWQQSLIESDQEAADEQAAAGDDEQHRSIAETVFTAPPDTSDADDKHDEAASGYSPEEKLLHKPLGSMTDAEIEMARRLIAPLIALFANYASFRYVRDNRGDQFDFRRMLRHSALHGRDDIRLFHRRRRIKKTRLMLLCDVSGSMERYSRFLIQFIYALHRELSDLDVAVFATRMTPITDLLQSKGVEDSLRLVSAFVKDWAGGTNIGASIREFNDYFAHQMLRSRTIMIILSDGWDRGDPYLMREEMEHLHRRVHKLIWLNPLLGQANYRPLTKGMQVALPYLDYFLSAHNLESLAKLARTLKTI